jgi:hypothetical protein
VLVVLEIVPAKILAFFQFAVGDQINQSVPDYTSGSIEFAGEVVNGYEIHRNSLPRFGNKRQKNCGSKEA